MTWEVLLTGRSTRVDLSGASGFATFVSEDEYRDREELLADADRFDAVVVHGFTVDDAFLDAASSLRALAKLGVGVDTIDVQAATERDVVVCNARGANARAVAEHAFSLFLAVRHRILEADRHLRAGGWDRSKFVTSEFENNVLGLYGFGNTGRALADIVNGAGMDVVTYDPYVADADLPDVVTSVATKTEFFSRADAVSVHAPLTEETRGSIGRAELTELSGGILINTARGEIVDEAALIDVLERSDLEGAGIDVFAEEPPDRDGPLFKHDRVVTTPHVAGWTVEANAAKNHQTVKNLQTVYKGGIPETALNASDLRDD